MNSWRRLVAVVAVLLWSLSAPLAMAADHCMAMGATCEGPCGASACVVSAPASASFVTLATPAYCVPVSEAPQTVPTVLKLPPK